MRVKRNSGRSRQPHLFILYNFFPLIRMKYKEKKIIQLQQFYINNQPHTVSL